MNGMPCPKCGNEETHLLSTTNEWKYFCPNCDVRFNDEGKLHPFNAATPEEIEAALGTPDPFFVTMKFGAVEAGWKDSVDAEQQKQLDEGEWRILSFGFDQKHGVGLLFLKRDGAPLGDDHYQALMSLGSLGEMLFKAMSNQAARIGRL